MEEISGHVGTSASGTGESDGPQDESVENGELLDLKYERNAEEADSQPSDESCRKRKVKAESSENVHKRKRMLVRRLKMRSLRRGNAEEGRNTHPYGPSLSDLSDELLLVVLRSLPPRDVHSLGQVSSRFVNVVADHTLWVSPDFRHQRGLTCEQFCEQYMPFLGTWTASVATRGPLLSPEPARLLPRVCDYLSSEFLDRLENRCPNLKSLILRDHRIDAREVCMGTLPRHLERLAFRRCGLVGTQLGESYFTGIHTALSHLQELELNRCPWFFSHSLMALSKCAHLKVLRITQCPGIVDSLPYTSLSCRFGFKSLEVLDLRQTPVGDPEVACFSQLQSLEELLLERPGSATPPVPDTSDSSDNSDAELLPGPGSRWPLLLCRCGDLLPEGGAGGRPCHGGATCGCWGTGGNGLALSVLDLRQTPVGDPEVACFSQLQSLEELLLERPGSATPPVPDTSDSSDNSDAELLPGPGSRWPLLLCRCGDLLPEGGAGGRPCHGGATCGCWGTGGRCSPPRDDVDNHQHAHSSWHHDISHMIPLAGRHPGINCVDWSPSLVESVSDTGICSLGNGTRSTPGVVVVRMNGVTLAEHNPRLRKLVVRGFSYVTDASVRYLALVNTLRHLDLAGCGVTRRALESFSAIRPDVEVVGLQRKKTEWEEYRDQMEGALVEKVGRDAGPENGRSVGHPKTSQRTG